MVEMEAYNGRANVTYITKRGTDKDGNLLDGSVDGYVGVYDVRSLDSYEMLRNKVS